MKRSLFRGGIRSFAAGVHLVETLQLISDPGVGYRSIHDALRLLGMSWGVKTTFLEAPRVSLGGSGVSIGGVGSLSVMDFCPLLVKSVRVFLVFLGINLEGNTYLDLDLPLWVPSMVLKQTCQFTIP